MVTGQNPANARERTNAEAEVRAEPGPATPPEPSPRPSGDDKKISDLFRQLAVVLGNVTVLTGLLVYFGWQRSEVQAKELGIDESILGMSTREYVLRSVQPVLVLVLVIGAGGMVWLMVDHWLVRRLQDRGRADPVVKYSLRLLPFAWLALPAAVWALGFVTVLKTAAFIAWPFSIGAGVLLTLYAAHLRWKLPGADAPEPGKQMLLQGFTAIIVGVTLFWGATNYASVLGSALAKDFQSQIGNLTQVVVYSPERLHLTAPGAVESQLHGSNSAYQYRYNGLRLLEHTGGHYFLISNEWSKSYGVVIMLSDNDPVRLEFVRGSPQSQ